MSTRALAILIGLLTAAVPAAAEAATVRSEPSPSRYYAPKLTFEASPGEVNDVTVSGSSAERRVVDSGAPLVAGDGCRQVSEHEAVCGNATEMYIRLGDAADRITLGDVDASGSAVSGGAGDDVLTGGPGSERLSGGDGSDAIAAGAGHDSVAGDDGTAFGDRLDGGPGNDDLDYRFHPAGVRVDLSDPAAGAPGEDDMQTGFEEVTAGTAGPSELVGDDGANMLIAEGPGSHVAGRGGSDYLWVARGGTADGGPGGDRVTSVPGTSAVCGEGNDVVWSGSGGYRRQADWLTSDFGLVAPDCERLRLEFPNINDSELRPYPKLSGARAKFRIPCPNQLDSRDGCLGRLRLRDTRGRSLGVRHFRAREGRAHAVAVALDEKTRRRMGRASGLDVVVSVLLRADGELGDATYTANLRAP